MTYTVEIEQTGEKAESIINMLKTLSADYDFLKIYKNKDALTTEQKKEIDSRYEYVLKNQDVGKTWEEFELEVLTK